jgi:hypothetical protein
MDISKMCESIKDKLKTSAKESLGFYKQKQQT